MGVSDAARELGRVLAVRRLRRLRRLDQALRLALHREVGGARRARAAPTGSEWAARLADAVEDDARTKVGTEE
jgi:hypothetical protein